MSNEPSLLTCMRRPPNGIGGPCQRADGHDGPCAHPFARRDTEKQFPSPQEAEAPTRNVLDTFREGLGIKDGLPLHDLAWQVVAKLELAVISAERELSNALARAAAAEGERDQWKQAADVLKALQSERVQLASDYDTALAKLAEVEKERDQYRDRLQIDPGGSDKIDELQTACDMLRAQNADMRAELDEARKIVGGEAYDLAHLRAQLAEAERVKSGFEAECTRWILKFDRMLNEREDAIAERDAAQARVGEMEGLLRKARSYIAKHTTPTVEELASGSIVDRIDAALATSPHRLVGRE